MKILRLLAFVFLVPGFVLVPATSVFASVAAGAESKPAEKKVEPVQNLDSRISQLQKMRDCIDSAKTKDAVQACRKDLKLKRQKERRSN